MPLLKVCSYKLLTSPLIQNLYKIVVHAAKLIFIWTEKIYVSKEIHFQNSLQI